MMYNKLRAKQFTLWYQTMKTIDFFHKFLKAANSHTENVLDEMVNMISDLTDPTDDILLMVEPTGAMIAFFIEDFDNDRQTVGCYVYVGQHSEACMHYVHSCKSLDFIANPSQENDAKEFLGHLRNGIGYNPRPVSW